jgi:hypothetical protein
MTTITRRWDRKYLVVREIVAQGGTVPCGRYKGPMIQLGVSLERKVVWQERQYLLRLPLQHGEYYVDVTEHLASGAILIHQVTSLRRSEDNGTMKTTAG